MYTYIGLFRGMYLYEQSTCRYVRLNALNVLHIHGPCFNAPFLLQTKLTIYNKIVHFVLDLLLKYYN